MRVIEHLLKAIKAAAMFNSEIELAPACILWPDRDRQWEAIIPRLQDELPELFVLSDYTPEKRAGPAIWLRCVISNKVEDFSLSPSLTPILYLPGIGRQDLRAVESCPDSLKPIAELQYRGVIWSQANAKDWTILAFLKSDQGGLGLDVAQGNEAKNAMQLALERLLDEDVEFLKGKRLDKDYFNALLTGGDPERDMLLWLDQDDAFREKIGASAWKAFGEFCKSYFIFDPDTEGILAGAAKLAAHKGKWKAVWERFCEAPKRYPNIPQRIRGCKPPVFDLFVDIEIAGGWPQWNDAQENALRESLLALEKLPPHEARNKLPELFKQHGRRKPLVWTELGESPLVQALEYLAALAEVTKSGLAAGNVEELAAGYQRFGWKADDAIIRALSFIGRPEDLNAVSTAIRSIYIPWAEESARYMQKIIGEADYPGSAATAPRPVTRKDGDCILFVDGLRFDIAKRLADMLKNEGFQVEEQRRWAPLPSVTGTGKPAVAPIQRDGILAEEPAGYNFELLNAYQLKKSIEDNGWTILEKNHPYPSISSVASQKLWSEFGNIDQEGHNRGWKIAGHIDSLLKEILDHISNLLKAGWKTIEVVTDHGWLLLPGGLPKIDVPAVLTENKWGRCASLKPGASTKERLFPWFWNPNQYFVLADGICCFRRGEEYTHGGLSLQECLLLELTVTEGVSTSSVVSVEFTDVVWKGMRCTVVVDGNSTDLLLDIRTQPANSSSSVVLSTKTLKDDGTASVVVDNEDFLDQEAALVLLDAKGNIVAQVNTVIGGGTDD